MKSKLLIFILSAGLLFPSLAWPQLSEPEVDRATRETDRSMREKAEEKLRRVPEKPPQIEKDEEAEEKPGKQKIFVKEIKLIGTESFPPEEFDPLVSKYENKEVTLDDLNNLARQIQREYLRRGIIVACFIPPQDVKEGIVILQVIEAKMGKLHVPSHKYFNKKRINYYWMIKPDEILRYDKMYRSLQFMNKNPDREVKARLHAGEKPGTTDVLLDIKTYPPFHVTGSFDNEGTTSTGKSRSGAGFKHNNLLGLDDTFLAGYMWGKSFSSIYAYHTIPITNFGTSLLYGFSYSKSHPGKEFEVFGINSRSKNTSVFLYQDLYSKDAYIGEAYLGFDAKDKTVTQSAGTTNRDRLRIFRLGGNFIKRGIGNITYLSPEVSQGVHAFGAREKNRLSSRGAESDFTKLNLKIQHKRVLPFNLQGTLKIKSQFAFEKLTSQEQMFLGGINSVRGYPSGDFLADSGLQANLEIQFPSFFIPSKIKFPYSERTLKENVTPILFCDYGYGKKRGATAGEESTVRMIGVGAGLRIRVYNQALLRLEWGFPVGVDTLTEQGNSRFHFSMDFEESLPREIQRIRKMKEEKKKEKQEEARIKGMYKKAIRLYKLKKYQKAYQAFREIQAISPNYGRTKSYLDLVSKQIKQS